MDTKELLDTSHPLLTMFREKAPGSFKHCQTISSICAEIVKRVPALDATALTIAAAYHDIGKIANAKYFSENMNGTNHHENLDPQVSFQYITRHVSDSVLLLTQAEFPREVINIVSEHHGDTVCKFFYEKAKKAGSVDEADYRYISRKPSTDEAAILVIVDNVEATARSVAPNGKIETLDEKISLIDSSINRLIDDSQLDQLTIGTMKVVKNILVEELSATYHNRVDYEESDAPRKDEV